MATATGKKMRRMKGLTRHQLHRASHAIKSDAKIRRMNWKRIQKAA